MDENIDFETDADVVEEESDFAPLAVAGLALAGATALGVVAGRKYGSVKERVQEKLAARRAAKAEETELTVVENTDEDD